MSEFFNIDKILNKLGVGAESQPSIDMRFRLAFTHEGKISQPPEVDLESGVLTFVYTIPTEQGELDFVCHQKRNGTTTVIGTDIDGKPVVVLVTPKKDGGVSVLAKGEEKVYNENGEEKPKKVARKKTRKKRKRSILLKDLKPPKEIIGSKLFSKKIKLTKLKLKEPKKGELDSNLFQSGLDTVKASKQTTVCLDGGEGLLAGAKLISFPTGDAVNLFDSASDGAVPGITVKASVIHNDDIEIEGDVRLISSAVPVALKDAKSADQIDATEDPLTQHGSKTIDGAALMVSEDAVASDSSLPVRDDNTKDSSLASVFDKAIAIALEAAGKDGKGVHSPKQPRIKLGLAFDSDGGHHVSDVVPHGIEAAQLAADKVVMAQMGAVVATISKAKAENRAQVNPLFDSEQTGDQPKDGRQGGGQDDDGQSDEQFA